MSRTREVLILFSLLISMQIFSLNAFGDEEYAQQLKAYEQQKASDRQEYEAQVNTSNRRALVLLIAFGAITVYLVVASRRRAQKALDAYRVDSDRNYAQNQRIIELLEAIDRKLKPPGT